MKREGGRGREGEGGRGREKMKREGEDGVRGREREKMEREGEDGVRGREREKMEREGEDGVRGREREKMEREGEDGVRERGGGVCEWEVESWINSLVHKFSISTPKHEVDIESTITTGDSIFVKNAGVWEASIHTSCMVCAIYLVRSLMADHTHRHTFNFNCRKTETDKSNHLISKNKA